jgi:phosphinothricin acetyltransferase
VAAIFNDALARGENTLDVGPRSADEIGAWVTASAPRYEAWVALAEDAVVGFGALTQHHAREAYGPTAELSLFVRPASRRAGVGRALARVLLARATALGFHSVVGLTQDAEHLRAFLSGLGFLDLGRLQAAYPFGGEWRDIVVWQAFVSAPVAP